MADGYYWIPLHSILRPANENESPHFAEDLDATLSRHPRLRQRFILADRGYDALPNFEHAVKRHLTPVIDVRRPPKDKETKKRRYDGLYDKEGRPICVGGKSMTYLGTDSEGNHWFRCPPGAAT